MHRRPSRRLAALAIAAILLLGTAASAAGVTSAAGYSTTMPLATWEVLQGEIPALGTSNRPGIVVKSFSPGMDPVKYLNAASAAGLRVVLYFMDTVDYPTGTVYPSRIKAWVDKVKTHPAVYGYLSVKEPSWNGITVTEMRSLYKAFKAADPYHRVIALLGDVPHFGTSANPWASGIANILWVDWYPVTFSKGYIPNASIHFPKVRAYVNQYTPGTPIWLMVQGHEYRKGDRRAPTNAELDREVRDGLTYLKANGIIFYTWHNPLYEKDLERNPTLWTHAKWIVGQIRAGTF